jgi:hypothetical protein
MSFLQRRFSWLPKALPDGLLSAGEGNRRKEEQGGGRGERESGRRGRERAR